MPVSRAGLPFFKSRLALYFYRYFFCIGLVPVGDVVLDILLFRA